MNDADLRPQPRGSGPMGVLSNTDRRSVHSGEVVDVWRADLQAEARLGTKPAAWLSPDERARMVGHRDPAAGLRFASGRGLVRRVLALYLDAPPESLAFRYGAHGKPALGGRWEGSGWEFSVSHTGDLMLLAVAHGLPLGVDVEALREIASAERLARTHLADDEWAEYRGLAKADRPLALIQAWTRKEAFAKAEGLGLRRPLRDVQVTFRPGVPGQLRQVAGAPPPRGWSLQAWTPLPGYTAAIVKAGGDPPLRFLAWPSAPRER